MSKPPIQVWRFYDAPQEYQDLSRHAGDEDWVALVPVELAGTYINWIESSNTPFAICDFSRHPLPSGEVVFIGAHA